MGLHRKESLVRAFTNEAEYLQAIRIFWTVYALDRRWSFGTGLPFALQDDDIDQALPDPVRALLLLIYSLTVPRTTVNYISNISPSTTALPPKFGGTTLRLSLDRVPRRMKSAT